MGVHRSHWRRVERPVCGWQSLTDTELRVAAIVAEGLTNAQVAERLFVSRHTVDFHLRQIFRKLAVRSRTELARSALGAEEHRSARTVNSAESGGLRTRVPDSAELVSSRRLLLHRGRPGLARRRLRLSEVDGFSAEVD
jgi:DNA-binding CsgD family transcriptional regulator